MKPTRAPRAAWAAKSAGSCRLVMHGFVWYRGRAVAAYTVLRSASAACGVSYTRAALTRSMAPTVAAQPREMQRGWRVPAEGPGPSSSGFGAGEGKGRRGAWRAAAVRKTHLTQCRPGGWASHPWVRPGAGLAARSSSSRGRRPLCSPAAAAGAEEVSPTVVSSVSSFTATHTGSARTPMTGSTRMMAGCAKREGKRETSCSGC